MASLGTPRRAIKGGSDFGRGDAGSAITKHAVALGWKARDTAAQPRRSAKATLRKVVMRPKDAPRGD